MRHLFNESEREAIRRTSISSVRTSDRMIWGDSKDGQYTVKIGYWRVKEGQRIRRGSEGTSINRKKEKRNLWRRVWTLNIKRKVHHLLWKEVQNKLPVGQSLRKRGIQGMKSTRHVRIRKNLLHI